MPEHVPSLIYWDSSAVLSALFKDSHSRVATEWASKGAYHLISSLAYAETCSVISRMKRERILGDEAIDIVVDALDGGPWHHLNLSPDREIVRALTMKWSLRGADLWHLATAKTLQIKLPEIYLLTFDGLLEVAARGEGLVR